MGTNLLGELVANNGTYYLQATELELTYTANIDQIIVRGNNLVIIALEVIRDGEYVDVLSDYMKNPNVPNDLRITPKNNEVFARITVSSAGGFEDTGFELVLAA